MNAVAKVALITGGSSGIGRGISVALAQRGYSLVIVGRTHHRIEETVRLLRRSSPDPRHSRHLGLTLDISGESDAKEMASRALGQFARIDLLVTSAGIGRQTGTKRVLPHPSHRLPLREWNEVIDVNLTGVFLSNRAVLPAMIDQLQGHIINVCSSTTPQGLRGTAFAPAYCASKFAVVGLTESLAEEVGRYGIRVQALFPGPVSTPLVSQTTLARPFGGRMSTQTFAESVVRLLELPTDNIVVHPHLLPSRIPKEALEAGRNGLRVS